MGEDRHSTRVRFCKTPAREDPRKKDERATGEDSDSLPNGQDLLRESGVRSRSGI